MELRSILRAAALLGALTAASAAALPPPFVREWHWSVIGFDIGEAALEAVDVDGDGELEVLATARTGSYSTIDYWYLLEARGNGYEQTWSSGTSLATIAGIGVAQVDPGGAAEIVTAIGSQLTVHDGATRAIVRSLPIAPTQPTALGVGDLDADGVAEAVVIDDADLYVYDLVSGALEQKKSGFGGLALDVGQGDGDPALEIVVANHDLPGYVLDGATRAVEWGRNDGLGIAVRFAQLDSDPAEEVIAGWEWDEGVRAFDLPSGTEKWQSGSGNLAVVGAADLDGDGVEEVLVADDQWGALHVLAGGSGLELWSAGKPEYGASGVTAGDVDGDGTAEILVGMGNGSSGPDRLAVYDSATRTIEWTSWEMIGPLRAMTLADLEGDDRAEIVTGGAVEWGYPKQGLVLSFDGYTQDRGRQGVPVEEWGPTLVAVRAANFDQDPQDEFCAIVNTDDTGRLACFDGKSWQEQWGVVLPEGLGGASLAIGDVDADGALELVLGGRRLTTASGAFIRSYRGDTGWLEWQSEDLNAHWSSFTYLRLGELDGDAALEIVALDRGDDRVVVLDGAQGDLQGGPWVLEAFALEVAELDGEPPEEVYVALGTPEIARLSTIDGTTESVLAMEATAVALRVASVDPDEAPELVYVADGSAQARDVEGGEVLWTSAPIGPDAGADDALLVGDADHDGAPDVLVGTKVGFVLFATSIGEQPLFHDGFESGDTGEWLPAPPG